MLEIMRYNMPAWVQRVRRSVRRKPVEAKGGGGEVKESPSLASMMSFLTQVLEGFPEAKEAVLRGLREMGGGPREPILGST